MEHKPHHTIPSFFRTTGLLCIIIAVILLLPPALQYQLFRTGAPVSIQSPEPADTPGPSQGVLAVKRSVTITAVGDLMVHQRQLMAARQKNGSYDFSNCFAEVAPYLDKADLTFANLETTLLGKNYSGYPQFSTPDSYLDAIKAAGFDVLTTANNHCLDTRLAGLLRTIDTVRSYGFHQTGTFKSPEEYKKPLIIDVRGIKVGVIAYTHGVGMEKSVSSEQFSYCVRVWKRSDYKADVKACRDAGADIVVISVHWGHEYERLPNSQIQAESLNMLKAGADLILGSHPHVVEPIEILEVTRNDGTTARCAVAYSMGNFISNQRTRYSDCGIIFNITLQEDEQGRFQIASLGYVPTYVNRDSNYTDYRVLPISEYISDPIKLKTLDSGNQAAIKRAWSDLTTHLLDGPAVLTTR